MVIPRAPRKKRKELTQEELARKRTRWNPNRPTKYQRYQAEQGKKANVEEDEQDFIITELFENGTLKDLIVRVSERGLRWPNRVLWSFWLCLVKQCIALAFPVRKFHPNRKNSAEDDLDEFIPENKYHWRTKRMVHFDMDPTNEFIAGIDLNTERRDRSKDGYFSPEQFTEEWDLIPADRNGANVCDEPVVGNYGPHTNVWGIALILFNIITGCYPRLPPTPGYITSPSGAKLMTYGMDLLEKEWNYVDRELRWPCDVYVMIRPNGLHLQCYNNTPRRDWLNMRQTKATNMSENGQKTFL
ncbi:hypothetical protein F4779DRAFT_547416 [Xylariaceae sp. FL0662B]|nr:hypothetical protein F4779DRAFT_547416 [Xylariaceae sp. FL0662B]